MLKIRPFEWSDVEFLNQRFQDPNVLMFMARWQPFTDEETVKYFSEIRENDDIALVAEYDGKVAGSIEIRKRKSPKMKHVGSIGIAIKKEFWGKGIATRLMEEAEKEARKKKMKKLNYELFEPNKRAINLVEDCGFKLAGRLKKEAKIGKKYVDELIFEKLL